MSTRTLLICLSLYLFIASCKGQHEQQKPIRFPYDLTTPFEKIQLPDTLHEVSGITWKGESEIACIQDENGIIFLYNLGSKTITETYTFAKNGDYEGITSDGTYYWVLRSDGALFRYHPSTNSTDSVFTGIPSKNNEGLCYDSSDHRLLIAAKGKLLGGKEMKGIRKIFAIDLSGKNYSLSVAAVFNLDEIRERAVKLGVVKKWRSKKKSGEQVADVELHISAIARHPLTGNYYAISDHDNLLFVLDKDFSVKRIINLDPALFNKAEGITFSPDGEMLISNEGQQGKPSLLRFSYMER